MCTCICAHGGIINLYNIFFSRCKRIPLLCAHRRLEVEIFRMKKSLFIVACMDRLFICNLLPPFTPSFAAMPVQREPNSQHCRKFVVISCFMYWFFPLPSVALFSLLGQFVRCADLLTINENETKMNWTRQRTHNVFNAVPEQSPKRGEVLSEDRLKTMGIIRSHASSPELSEKTHLRNMQ